MELIYDEEILGRYVEQTNLKVSKQPEEHRAWKENKKLTIGELKKYLAVDLYMDIVVREGSVGIYWSTGMWGDDFVKSVFGRDRFLRIRSNLTWTDTTDVPPAERAARNAVDGFWTITGLFDAVKNKYQKFYTPTSKLSIDEVCVFFKGRHRCRCYNPSKPNKWHFKIYALCDASNGFVYDWFLYRGKDERRPVGSSASEYPVDKLTSDNPQLHNKGYLLSADNWFSSCKLVQRLQEGKGIGYVGTIRTNRQGFPREAVFPKTGAGVRARGSMKCMKITINGMQYYLTSWQDTKPVHILSTFAPKKVTVRRMIRGGANGQWIRSDVPCPTSVPVYNDGMKGCDVSDQNNAYYDARRRVQGRWQPRLDRRVLKTSAIAANIIRNKNKNSEETLLVFLKKLVTQWSGVECPEFSDEEGDGDSENLDLNTDEDDSDVEEVGKKRGRRTLKTWEKDFHSRKTGRHFAEILPSMKAGDAYSNPRASCMLCKDRVASKCQTCGVYLCLKRGDGRDCFTEFHCNKILLPHP